MSKNPPKNVPEVASHDLLGILFVYARMGKVRCLNRVEATAMEPSLIADGWNHTATIHPARWIESLCMGYGDPCDMIDELQFSHNTQSRQPNHQPEVDGSKP